MIAVMAAVAIPAYKDYQRKAQEAAAIRAMLGSVEGDVDVGAVSPGDPASTPSGR